MRCSRFLHLVTVPAADCQRQFAPLHFSRILQAGSYVTVWPRPGLPQSAQDGPEERWTGPRHRQQPGHALRGIHGHRYPKGPVCREPDREGARRPEAAVGTCRAEQGGAQPEGLCRLPGLPGGWRRGAGRLPVSLLLPAEAALAELRGVAAESGAPLPSHRAPGPRRQPGGGGEVGSRRPGALGTATVSKRRWVLVSNERGEVSC